MCTYRKIQNMTTALRQRGAVLLLVTFSLIAILGFAALAIDVGRLYIIKSQLQNAADAGALAGAKPLDGTSAGVALACVKASEAALKNKSLLMAQDLDVGDLTIEIGTEPYGGTWVDPCAPSVSNLGPYMFARVTTQAPQISSIFARVLGIDTNAVSALAVAGRHWVEITPLAMCAIDNAQCPPASGNCGYVRGLNYKVSDINPIGPGTMYWLDPLATAPNCSITNANDMRPYVCQGKVGISGAIGSTVYTNTGVSSGPMFGAMDSRFGDYPSQAQCEPATAPPDANVKVYHWNDPLVSQWMTPVPTRQAANLITKGPPMQVDTAGVVWAASRPGAPLNATRGINTSYYPSTGTPYSQRSGGYYQPPSGTGAGLAMAERRVMNLVIVDCPVAGGVCRPATVKAVGKFFLTRKANAPASDKDVYVEFSGLVEPGKIRHDVKLYR